jgi:hypothetical protein
MDVFRSQSRQVVNFNLHSERHFSSWRLKRENMMRRLSRTLSKPSLRMAPWWALWRNEQSLYVCVTFKMSKSRAEWHDYLPNLCVIVTEEQGALSIRTV